MSFRIAIIAAIIMQLAGCAHYYAMSDNINVQLDEWLAQNEYGRINETIGLIDETHANYAVVQSRRGEIKQKKTAYINTVIDKAQQAKAAGKLSDALHVLDEALVKVPKQTELVALHDKYLTERDSRIMQLRKDMLLRRARALVQYEPIYHELGSLIPEDYAARSDIDNYHSERNEIAEHLLDCSRHALAQKDYALAEECLSLSNTLVHSADKQAVLEKTRLTIRQTEEKQKIDQLLAGYQQAYDSGELVQAGKRLDELLVLRPDHAQARALREQMDAEIRNRVGRGLETARTLYSQGKISEALELCNMLLLIDPKNEELQLLVNRAGKVSKNIEKLSKDKALMR